MELNKRKAVGTILFDRYTFSFPTHLPCIRKLKCTSISAIQADSFWSRKVFEYMHELTARFNILCDLTEEEFLHWQMCGSRWVTPETASYCLIEINTWVQLRLPVSVRLKKGWCDKRISRTISGLINPFGIITFRFEGHCYIGLTVRDEYVAKAGV